MVKSIYSPEAGGILQFPDEATPQEMLAYIDANYGGQGAPAPAPATGPDQSGLFGRFAYGLGTGFTEIPGGIASLLYPAEEAKKTAAGQFSEEARKFLQETFGIDPTKDPTAAQQAAEALGSVASFLIPGTGAAKAAGLVGKIGAAGKALTAVEAAAEAANAAKIAARAGSVTAAAQGAALGAQQRSEKINQQLEAGMQISPEKQLAAQRLDAFVGLSEALPLEKFFGPLTKLLEKIPASKAHVLEQIVESRLGRITKAGLEEGAQEAAQNIANDIVEYGVYNPDVQIGQDILSNAGTGAFAGSFVEGLIQLAAGRKLRPYRQLQADLAAEIPANTAARRQGEIAVAADTLAKAKVSGGVSVEEEEFDGRTNFVVKTPSGESVGNFRTPEDAQQAVELYKQRTGANVSVRQAKDAPSVFPVRIGSSKFNSMDDVAKARDSLIAKRDSIVDHISNPNLLNRVSSEQKVSPEFYKAKQQKDLDGINKAIKRYDDFINTSSSAAPPAVAPAPKETSVKNAPMSPAVTPSRPDIAESEASAEEVAPEPPVEENIPEPIAEYSDEPIGAVGPEPAVSEAVYEEAPPAVPPVTKDAPVTKTVTRPSATAAQLDELKTKLFGESKNVRDMTPDELNRYNTERDKLYPPVEETVYTSAGPIQPRPTTISEAMETGPVVSEYNDATKKWYADLLTGLQSRLKGIVPTAAEINLQQLVGADKNMLIRGQARAEAIPGGGIKSIIDLSTGILRPGMTVEDAVKELIKTLDHEVIHVLRDQGLLRPEEWRILSKAVAGTKVPGRAYTYLDKAEAVYTPGGRPIAEIYADPDAVVEEAVAEMYKDWALNNRAPGNTRGLFNRITEFFRSIFRAIKSSGHENVFKGIEAGEVGAREGTPRTEGSRLAAEPIDIQNDIAWTQERIDREIHTSHYSDGRSKAYVGWVNPRDFVGATDTGRVATRKKIERDSAYYDDFEKIKDNDQAPYLRTNDDMTRVFDHNGRHRMTALARMGIDRVPVVVTNFRGAMREPISEMTLKPQTTSKFPVTIRDLIPLNEKYRADIEAAMEKPTSGLRFSAAPTLDSDEFKLWFKNSVAVNKDGTPMRFLHGTPYSFDKFGKARSGAHKSMKSGPFFFTTDPKFADDYSLSKNHKGGYGKTVKSGSRTLPVYLSVQNPADFFNPEHIRIVATEMARDRNLSPEDTATFVNAAIKDPDWSTADWQTMERYDVQKAIRDSGFDGFYLMENGRRNLAVFSPNQVKSIFNQFEEGAATDERFSAAPLPPNIATANQSLFAPAKKNTILQTVSDFFFQPPGGRRILNTAYGPIEVKQRKYAGLQFRANVIDNNAVVEFLEKLKNEKTTGEYQLDLADYSATAALTFDARASQLAVSAILLGNLKVNFARPGDMQSAVVSAEENNDNLLSVITTMLAPGPIDPATGKPGNKTDIFRSYAVAIRGRNKKAAGEKVPAQLTDTYIRDTIAFTQANYPEIVDAYNMYQRVNKRMMEAVRDSGRISDASFTALTRDMDYYGFFREMYEEELSPTTPSKTAADIKFREYTGSEAGNLLGDPIAVMIKNFQFLTSMATKNIATQKVFNLTRDMGEARLLGTGQQPDQSLGEAKDVMFFHDKGVLKRFAVKDPLLVMALGSDPHVDIGGAMKLIGLPTRVIRETVTRDPGFMLANLLRDTVSAWITSGEDITPFLGTARGMVNALKDGTSFKALMAHGVVGSYDMAMKSADEVSAQLQRRIVPKGVHLIGSPQGLASATRMLWDRLGVLSEASDAATRIAVYEAAKKQGLSDAEAAFRSIRILDFSRHGGSQFLSMLTKLIPFLNARIQGLDVLAQAGAAAGRFVMGKSQSQRDANLGKKFLVRGAILAAISVALEAFNEDDEDYQNLPQYVKTGNLLIPLSPFGMKGQFIGIPKAFEPGLLFSTFPQQFYASMNGQASSRENINMFVQSFASTFGVNPIPQIILPLVEVATNHDFYTGLPLISEGKMRLAPELQYDSRTSTLSMMLGKIPIWYNMDTGKFTGISPIILEKLISGYSGPFGSMLVSGAGMAMDGVDIGPERLPKSFSQLPVIRRVFIDAESKNPKAVTQAYELFRIVDEANRSFSRLRQTGDAEATIQFYEENKDVLSYKKYVFKMVDRLNKLSAYERQIERDQSMSREDKLAAMEQLRQARIQLTSAVKDINQKLGR